MAEEIKDNIEEDVRKKIEKEQGRIMRNILMVLGIFVVFFAVWLFISYNQNNFEHRGIKFEKVNEIAPFRTSLPVNYQNPLTGGAIEERDYYFYLRNDPRALSSIQFYGELNFLDNMVIDSTEDFNCGGDGIIGVANLAKLYQILGANVIKDENASCYNGGKYIFLQIESGNETKIEQIDDSCYKMSITKCEILKGTERFMVETLANIGKIT